MKIVLRFILVLIFVLPLVLLYAQVPNPIITAFPSLQIPNGSRGLSMGDCGIAASNGNDQLYYNSSKIAFTQNYHQASISYLPWLTGISNDTRMMNANYIANISNSSSMGVALSYLNFGSIFNKDNNGAILSAYNSSEYSLLGTYALQLGANASLGIGFRFLGRQPVPSVDMNGMVAAPNNLFTVSGDISFFQRYVLEENSRQFAFGIVLKNLGPKIEWQAGSMKTFLPTNLGLGCSYTNADGNTGDQFTLALDINKLLVPTPGGKNENAGIFPAMIGSFSDAPGGLKEELSEFRVGAGMEYGYASQFFMRAGVSLENRLKGNRKYLGLGVGYKGVIDDQAFGFDCHYLVPFATGGVISPFQNCWGITLSLNVGSFQ